MTKIRTLALFGFVIGIASLGAQTTLDQAVQAALAQGADQQIWASNLAASRATEAAARARAGLTVSSSAGYNASEAWNDPAAPLGNATATGTVGQVTKDGVVPQTASAGLTIGTPLTSVTVRGSRQLVTGPSSTNATRDDASVNLSQVLWNGYPGGPAQATAEKAALTLKVAELNAQANRNRLVLSVKQAFFTLLSAQESLNQLGQTQKQRQETVKFVQTKFDLGQATSLDLKQAKINARTADLDLDAGKSALDAARKRLANLMGRSDADGLVAASEPDPGVPVATADQAVALALQQRVEPLVAQANARSAQIDADTAFGSSTPSVTLTSGVAYSRDLAKDSGAIVGTLGVSVGAPLLDAGLASAQRTQADAQKTVAQTQYQQLLRSIPVDVVEAWNTWQVNQGRVEVSALALEVAQGQRLVVQTQFDAGLKTLTDLQTADITLSTAQLNLLKAKITAQLSALNLQSLLGQ